MSLQKFLEIIDTTFLGFKTETKAKILLETDPKRIYVENVRHFFNTSNKIARTMCEMAVKDKRFEKRIGVYCPNEECSKVIHSYNESEEITGEIKCENCELHGRENVVFDASKLERVEFYQLIENA